MRDLVLYTKREVEKETGKTTVRAAPSRLTAVDAERGAGRWGGDVGVDMGAVNIVGTGAVLISSTSWRELAAPSKTLDARVTFDMAFVEPQVVDILPKENIGLARVVAVII